MQRRTVNLMALAALGAIGSGEALAQKEKSSGDSELSFPSPEDAIEHVMAALRTGDLAAAVAAFGIDRQVRDYSFVKMAERLNAISLSHNPPPVAFPFYADVARAKFTYEAAIQLRNLIYSMLAPGGTSLDTMITPTDDQDIGVVASILEDALDPGRLANLSVLRTAIPNAARASSEQFRRVIAAQLAVTGGDDLQERFALLDLDGQTFRSGMTLVLYGDRWRLRSMAAPLGGSAAAGYAVPMTEQEFIYAVG